MSDTALRLRHEPMRIAGRKVDADPAIEVRYPYTGDICEVPGYRTEMSPFGGIKDAGLGYKEGVAEEMKSYTHVKTYSLPWS